ncbi:LOW QUALITY PROTEIN: putative 1-phosphatidylinositol-3-phosphate 5-kinase FAB1D [Neltuma alba]|uniref:LOW QUALITY PROTEIN: putative 1-phosphatidylinositol-3-phosphate 5-kinase FAB1D n=1 Tax=Neltuma alba TaxID=207710 RepID=UPI0010A3337B|nr:LOW QUALITY PROTEIN: putative 1-phosphatidylinositol-3-phosphate 5-kinase FAB1D [Prosopis alba]
MCHYCGAGLTDSKLDDKNRGNQGNLKLDSKVPIRPCKFCGEKQKKESVKRDSTSPCMTPLISPTTSLSSTDSCASVCSDFSVDMNSSDRVSREEAMVDVSREDHDYKLNEKAQNSSLKYSEGMSEKSLNIMENNSAKCNGHNGGDVVRDVEISQGQSSQEAKADSSEKPASSVDEEPEYSIPEDLDIQTWEPPDPENLQDDVDHNVGCDDDDDECTDSVNWGEPTSLNCSKDELSGSYKFKEEKLRAMQEVINGRFKALVGQLLKSVGVSSSNDGGNNWVDIVTSLSWEAASFLKPDAIAVKSMNPDGYVKVKCIAAGTCSQSQIIKGLVFKKHAAHKHMPTNYKNPRLLLISGMLGHSCSGLSSFDSMEQEKDYLKSITDLIEKCHANVILVEKTVSRDIQESILKKGMTLVLDMKLHRLERVARCTGSPILSCDNLNGQKLKHCDSFYFEKFAEEHAGLVEGGKRPIKTLMFIEGCPTRLGCTILLKGANGDELKRVKCVLRCAVVMAYHLILETSFLVDQRAMFSTISAANVATHTQATDEKSHNIESSDSSIPSVECSSAENRPVSIEIPICNGSHEGNNDSSNLGPEEFSPVSHEIISGFSAISSSLKKVLGDSFPFSSSAPYQTLSAYFGLNERELDAQVNKSVSLLENQETDDNSRIEPRSLSDGETAPNGRQSQFIGLSEGEPDGQVNKPVSVIENQETDGNRQNEARIFSDEEKSFHFRKSQSFPGCFEFNGDKSIVGDDNNNQLQNKDDINAVLDSQSILVLMSSRNALRGTICQQSHFSHIMFYKNFDVPLGKFLQDNLLNQTRLCDTCHELPEAHFYYYAHHNKQLTMQVKQLPQEKCLPGAAEGKLWMWSRCGKCKIGSTKRVLLSTTARSLSFGKFLELSLSHYSSNRKSSCGHFLDRDFLYFFGLGHMVAMFRYSSVATYTVWMPPKKLEFTGAIRKDWLLKEVENVFMKGILLFTELANCLKTLKVKFDGSALNLGGSMREFSEVEEMLKQERDEFEVNIKNAVAKNSNPGQAAYILLSLNRLMWDLLIESCVWVRRMHSLFSPDVLRVDSGVAEKVKQELSHNSKLESAINEENGSINRNVDVEVLSDSPIEVNELPAKEIPIIGPLAEGNEQDVPSDTPNAPSNLDKPIMGHVSLKRSSDQELNLRLEDFTNYPSADGNLQAKDFVSNHQVFKDINLSISDSKVLNKSASLRSPGSNLLNSNEWFWEPFVDIRQVSIRELHKKCLLKSESVNSSITEHLPTANQLIAEEGIRLHVPLRTDDHVVSDYEGELSSIIACALALLKDSSVVTEVDNENYRRESGTSSKVTEILDSLTDISSPHTSIGSAADTDSVYSTGSASSEESRASRASENNGTEIAMGYVKSLGREKYSVICQYVNQFRELRNWCCPSELDYIASLSRCRNWDAKGGKSKSFFAKTLDDRFIIKEIKKTELDSFMGFAPLYFKYMKESFESGSQTCLAKVLGIYQVTKRNVKSGKESRHDLMVMENLSYNRNIARQYDLKGALYARYNTAGDSAGDVLLDQNFVNDMNSSPLYVANKEKRLLHRAVWNDTTFLNSVNVMDYSLLVGVDSQRRELVCGIIDYLRQYTWDKHFETWMKTSLVVPKNQLPTVISPKEYKKRFRKFMSTHFLSVPDHWCNKKFTDPFRLCGSGEDDSAQQNKEG